MTRAGRRGARNALIGVWTVVTLAGWGVSQWLGEPTATDGPALSPVPASGAEPGPQPEHDSPCGGPSPTPRPAPPPSTTGRSFAVDCSYATD